MPGYLVPLWSPNCYDFGSNIQKQKSIAVIQRGEDGWAMKDTHNHWHKA